MLLELCYSSIVCMYSRDFRMSCCVCRPVVVPAAAAEALFFRFLLFLALTLPADAMAASCPEADALFSAR